MHHLCFRARSALQKLYAVGINWIEQLQVHENIYLSNVYSFCNAIVLIKQEIAALETGLGKKRRCILLYSRMWIY